jgi:hypothetical protein
MPVLSVIATPALAAGIAGNWLGSINVPNGPVQVNFTFKKGADMLTGSTAGPDGSVVALQNVKVDGDQVGFSLMLSMSTDPATFNYTGVLAADELKLHTEFMGQGIDFTVKQSS